MAFNTQFGAGMFSRNQSLGSISSNSITKTQDDDTYNPRYPGFNRENYEKLERKVSELGLTGSKKQEVMDEFYRQILPQIEEEKKRSQRNEILNQKKFEVSQIQDDVQRKVANHTYTVEELAQKIKEKENLREDAPDAEVFNTWISSIPNGEELLGNYMNKGDMELLYVGGLTERPKETFGQKVADVAVGALQSPGKWGYNMVGQRADKGAKEIKDAVEGTDLGNWLSEKSTNLVKGILRKAGLSEEEINREINAYVQERDQALENGTAFNGREATDIRTPLLGEERANSKYTKAGEVVGDIGTAIALTAPMGSALAPIYADSTVLGAGILGAGEGALGTTLAHYGTEGNLNITPTEAALGIGGGILGGELTRYLANLPKTQSENIRKEASKYIEKSIKPTVKGKQSQAAYDKFIDDTLDVAHLMSKNKDVLQYTDDAGEIVTGKLPTNMRETSETIRNLKQTIYNQYNEIAKQAGDAGARVDLNKAFQNLDDLAKNTSQNIANPKTPGIVDEFRDVLLQYSDDAGTISIQDAQQITQDFNKQLTAFLNNTANTSNDVSRNSIISKLNKWIKDGIDDSIDDAFNDSISKGSSASQQYNQLKGAYSKLKTVEDEISKRALVLGRNNKIGLSQQVLDSLAGGEFTEALLSLDPVKLGKAGTMKAISMRTNWVNNPNTQLKNLFNLIEKVDNPTALQTARAGLSNAVRSSAQSSAPIVGAVNPGVAGITANELTND